MFALGAREILVGIGSNSADSLDKLREARALLRAHPRLRLKRCSAIYESDALLPPGAPPEWDRPFLNAALLLELRDGEAAGREEAERLLRILKSLEGRLGRTQGPRWSPRCIDLDLLAWGGDPLNSPLVNVPHQELLQRPFALLPAADCAPFQGDAALLRSWRYSPPERVPSRTRRAAKAAWPRLVAILNITPDSFSDGGHLSSPERLEAAAREAAAAGALVLDLGAESTRPGARPISAKEEQARLAPALELLVPLRERLGFHLSLDSRHAATVRWALENFPIAWINDVAGFTDPEMLEMGASSPCTLVAMHSLAVPADPALLLPAESDPVEEIRSWGEQRLAALASAGVAPTRVVLDPGIGFGKTPAQSQALLREAAAYGNSGPAWLIGHSRKRFLDPDSSVPAAERELETGVLSAGLCRSGVDYLRVHSPTLQARALGLGNHL